MRVSGGKKELLLEGFQLLEEWADKVGDKSRTRPDYRVLRHQGLGLAAEAPETWQVRQKKQCVSARGVLGH